jgi:hypothetical protein
MKGYNVSQQGEKWPMICFVFVLLLMGEEVCKFNLLIYYSVISITQTLSKEQAFKEL